MNIKKIMATSTLLLLTIAVYFAYKKQRNLHFEIKIDKNTIESVCLHYDTLFVITRSKTENTLHIFDPTSEKIETLKVERCKSVIVIDDLIYLSSDEELKVYNKRLQLLNVIFLPEKMNNFLFTFPEIKSKKDIYGRILYITNGKTTYVLGKNNKSKY